MIKFAGYGKSAVEGKKKAGWLVSVAVVFGLCLSAFAQASEAIYFNSADGIRLHARYYRAENARALLVMAHGLQSHSGWYEAAGTPEYLASQQISVMVYDRRGSGLSQGKVGDAISPEDFMLDFGAAVRELKAREAVGLPLHAFANCFGTRVVLPYAARYAGEFASIILTSPSTNMTPLADYTLLEKMRIQSLPDYQYVNTPLRDEYFTSDSEWLSWINQDVQGLRRVTARFLKIAAMLTKQTEMVIPMLKTPLLIVLADRDVMVDNRGVVRDLANRYNGEVEVAEFNSEHFVDISPAKDAYRGKLVEWILGHSN